MPSLDLSLMFTAWISSRTIDPKINGTGSGETKGLAHSLHKNTRISASTWKNRWDWNKTVGNRKLATEQIMDPYISTSKPPALYTLNQRTSFRNNPSNPWRIKPKTKRQDSTNATSLANNTKWKNSHSHTFPSRNTWPNPPWQGCRVAS